MGAFEMLEKGVKKLKTENGWIVIPKNFANYGTDYVTRAGIALIGPRRRSARRTSLPHRLRRRREQAARRRQPLRPALRQGPDAADERHLVGVDVRPAGLLRAERDQPLQPRGVDAARSTTPTARSTSTSRRASPGADKEANWLPAPASGPFNLTVRIFWPKEAVLDGSYKLPPVKKVQ